MWVIMVMKIYLLDSGFIFIVDSFENAENIYQMKITVYMGVYVHVVALAGVNFGINR